MIESQIYPSNEHIQILGWVLLNFIWQGLLPAAVLKGLLSSTRWHPSTFRYNVTVAVLFAMLIIPFVSFMKPHLRQTAVMSYSVQVSPGDRQETNTDNTAVVEDPTIDWTELLVSVQHILPWVSAFWLTGVLVAFTRTSGGLIKVLQLKRGAKKFTGKIDLHGLTRKLSIRSPIRLLETPRVTVPSIIGWFRPVILLPEGNRFPPEQVEALVAHELAHVRRRDYLINLFQAVVEALLFFHPAVWWVSSQVRIERESCCDDAAILACGDVKTYVRSLTEAERHRSISKWAVAASGAPLLNRIRRMTAMNKKPVNRLVSWSITIFVVSVIGTVVSGSSLLAFVPKSFHAPVERTVQTDPKVDSPSPLVLDAHPPEPLQIALLKAQSETSKQKGSGQEDVESIIQISPKESSSSLQVSAAPSTDPAQVAILEAQSETSEQTGSNQEDVVTKTYSLSHARASEVTQVLEETLGSDKFKIAAHPQTNSLVVTCAKEMNRKIGELIKLLDTLSPQKPGIRVIYLLHARASEVAQVLEETFSEHSEKPVIKVDTQKNALIVTDIKKDNRKIDELIKALDIPYNKP